MPELLKRFYVKEMGGDIEYEVILYHMPWNSYRETWEEYRKSFEGRAYKDCELVRVAD